MQRVTLKQRYRLNLYRKNTAEAVTGEEKTLNGTVDEIKDFMFIVTDDSGASYELSFDAKP